VKEEDRNKMATAVTTTSSDDARSGKAVSGPPAGGPAAPAGFEVFKPGEGYATRLGMMGVIAAYVVFAAWHWYYNWVFVRDIVDEMFSNLGWGKATRWMMDLSVSSGIAITGTVLIVGGGLLLGYYFIYIKRETAEYLIRTDTELAKVTWPKITPWFKTDTLVWGSTYVVLIVVVAMTVYVFGVDMVLQWISHRLFYS
jgi:preprotein translocase subunit SecE